MKKDASRALYKKRRKIFNQKFKLEASKFVHVEMFVFEDWKVLKGVPF